MENNLPYWYLRNHKLFKPFTDIEIEEICIVCEFKRAKKNGIIYSAFDEIERIYILCQGRIKIAYSLVKDFEVVAEILTEGDIFGDLTLKKSTNVKYESAQVLSGTATIVSFKFNEFEHILRKRNSMARVFAEMAADKLNIITKKYCDLAFKDVRSRVLNFFMLHARHEGKWTGSQAEIKMFCTHQDIADFTASSRQTVSTIIKCLVKEKKIIYEGRSKVIIPDIKKLET